MRLMGHENAFVLDGGLPKWIAEDHPVETGWREPPHGEFKAEFHPELVRELAQMQDIVRTGAMQVVDARAPGRFRGEEPEPRPGVRPGRVHRSGRGARG